MTAEVLIALVLSALLSVSAGLIALIPRAGSDDRLSMAHVGRAVLAVCATTVLEVAVLMWAVRLSPFGMIHLAWLAVSVVVPACGLAVLVARIRGRKVTASASLVAGLSLFMLPIAVKAHWIDPYDLRVERTRIEIPRDRAGHQSLVIGVLADLQTTRIGAHEEAAVTALMAAQPDIILVPGDLFQGPAELFDEVLPDFQRLLSRLSAPGGVWFVAGNTDYRAGLSRILEGTGARWLRDEVVRIAIGDRLVTLFGVDEPSSRGWTPRIVPGLAAFESAPGAEDIRILLAHRPRVVSELPRDTRVDLLVAGHTHGGQVAFPFLGPPLVRRSGTACPSGSPPRRPRPPPLRRCTRGSSLASLAGSAARARGISRRDAPPGAPMPGAGSYRGRGGGAAC